MTKVGDGYLGWPEHAPFDKIIVTCSPEKVPQPLVDQLAEGGLIVVPVGERYPQTLYLLRKKDGKLESRSPAADAVRADDRQGGRATGDQARPGQPASSSTAALRRRRSRAALSPAGTTSGKSPGRPTQKPQTASIAWNSRTASRALSAHLLQGFAIDGRQVKEIEIRGWVKTENVVLGPIKDEAPYLVVTLFNDQRKELDHLIIGPFRGTSDWHEESKTFKVPPEAREGIFRIGLFGATGTAWFDKVQVKKVK